MSYLKKIYLYYKIRVMDIVVEHKFIYSIKKSANQSGNKIHTSLKFCNKKEREKETRRIR
jgi:hypothetical protein